MTQTDLELMDKMHKLAHKSAVGYNLDYDEACRTYEVKIKSISITERYHTKAYKVMSEALEEAIKHLETIAYPNHDKNIHIVM